MARKKSNPLWRLQQHGSVAFLHHPCDDLVVTAAVREGRLEVRVTVPNLQAQKADTAVIPSRTLLNASVLLEGVSVKEETDAA